MIRSAGLRSLVSLLVACMVLALPLVARAAGEPAAARTSAEPTAVRRSGTPSFGHAVVVQRDGEPELQVDGKPFFFFGGAFFYERIPPSRWRASMLAMRALGANTLDLYIPWNWHEVTDGEFDFDGRTNPRRNLREVLRLGRELGFYFTIRPGPVIRNEWRNGGYPAWLLTRPEYAMPLHDVLEGRYPATATLQNAHADDAAAEWLRNATHLRYAARWLHRALAEVRPVADRVLAVQLDDDQAAYSDNQTYPAPNLQAYLGWLEAQAREVIGPLTPAFINTYQMRVPAAAPVWTMGNWYQSDADAIGEHDRGELAFSTLLLGTNQRGPLAVSEFQAGWLAAAENPVPRAADPTNTTLALGEFIALGAKGVIDFPLQDTLAPFGWEAPWSNALYAWGAALPLDGESVSERGTATARLGRTLAQLGPLLASARREADTAIVYAPEGYARPLVAEEYGALFARVREALAACRAANRDCDIVDPVATPNRLRRYATAVDVSRVELPRSAAYARALAAYRAAHGHIVASVPLAVSADPVAITRLRAANGATIVVARNWTSAWQRLPAIVLRGGTTIPAGRIAPRDALVLIGGRQSAASSAPPATVSPGTTRAAGIDLGGARFVPSPEVERALALGVEPETATTGATVRKLDVFEDGGDTYVLQNARVRAVIVADGGGRLVSFGPIAPADGRGNLTDATGALRDDVSTPLAPSPRDYIARYTHDYPAGTFNRPYRAEIVAAGGTRAALRLSYAMPDAPPAGARFEKIVSLGRDDDRLVVDACAAFPGDAAGTQRAVLRSSLPALAPLAGGPLAVAGGGGAEGGVARTSDGFAAAVSWAPHDVEAAAWTAYGATGTLALTLAPGVPHRVTFALRPVANAAEAAAFGKAERAWVAANSSSGVNGGEVAKRYTQSPQKRPSESSCGFESHLP
jgi:hypothetical protein